MILEKISDYQVHESYAAWEAFVRSNRLIKKTDQELYENAEELQTSSWFSFLWQMIRHPISFVRRRNIYQAVQQEIQANVVTESYYFAAGMLMKATSPTQTQLNPPKTVDEISILLEKLKKMPLVVEGKEKTKKGKESTMRSPLQWLKEKGTAWFKKIKTFFSRHQQRPDAQQPRFQLAFEAGIDAGGREVIYNETPAQRVVSPPHQLVSSRPINFSLSRQSIVSNMSDQCRLLLFRLGYLGIIPRADLTPDQLDQQFAMFKNKVNAWHEKELEGWKVDPEVAVRPQDKSFEARDKLFQRISTELLPYIKAHFFTTNMRAWIQTQTQMMNHGEEWYKQISTDWTDGYQLGINEGELLTLEGMNVTLHDTTQQIISRVAMQAKELKQIKQMDEETKKKLLQIEQQLEAKLEQTQSELETTRIAGQQTTQRLEKELETTRIAGQQTTQRLEQLEKLMQQLLQARGQTVAISHQTTSTTSSTPLSSTHAPGSPRLFMVTLDPQRSGSTNDPMDEQQAKTLGNEK